MSEDINKCVRDTLRDGTKGYCGKNIINEWHFLEPTHAILNNQQGGRLLICHACRKKINNIMIGII